MDGPWLRIGEVARRTGLTQRTLRHYDQLGLLVPGGRSDGDYRLYSRADLERLLEIQHLKSLGLSLAEVAEALDDPGADAATMLARHVAEVERRIAQEEELLTRLRRLQQAAGTGWEDVLEVIRLTERLRHPDAPVRFEATLRGATEAPLDELIDLLLDPEPGVREGAAWALTQRPGALGPLLSRLRGGDELARHALAHILGKLRDPAGVAVLVDLVGDPVERVAAKAAFSLGQLADDAAVASLVEALGDPRSLVRDEATHALAAHAGARGPLERALADSPSDLLREHAAEALGAIGDVASLAPLSAALADREPAVQEAALLAIGLLPGDAATGTIRRVADTANGRVRLIATRLAADRQTEGRSAR